jgi:hypothetical protein
LAARVAGAIVQLVVHTEVGAIALGPILDLTAIRLTGVIVVMAVIILRLTADITVIAMAITPLAIAAVIVAAMSRQQALPVWP